MIYVFDTSPFIILFDYYYQERFPTLWEKFYPMVESEKITSVREVQKELLQFQGANNSAVQWAGKNIKVFSTPTANESKVVSEIFQVPHFEDLLSKKQKTGEKPFADPFVIAKAKCIHDGCVVTGEKYKKGAAKIPNVCEHFNKIPCISLEQFMERENWKF